MESKIIGDAVNDAGIIIGSLTMLSAIWVWASKQQFSLGGSLLSFFGTVLIGLSVFSKAQITIGDTTIVLEALQQQVANLEDNNAVIADEVTKISRNVELQRDQFVALGESIRTANPNMTRPVTEIMRPLEDMESVGTGKHLTDCDMRIQLNK